MKTVVILSGGMDSTIALHLMRREHECYALSFYYKQKQCKELDKAAETCSLYGIPHRILDLSVLGDIAKTISANIMGTDVAMPEDANKEQQPVTYVPFRNMILLSLASSYAESIGAEQIVIGAQQQDHYGYWDCTPSFIEAMNAVISQNREHQIRIVAPFATFSKAQEIEALVAAYGEEEAIKMLSHTLTCYNPDNGDSCGHCPSCIERLDAFNAVNISDPVPYASQS